MFKVCCMAMGGLLFFLFFSERMFCQECLNKDTRTAVTQSGPFIKPSLENHSNNLSTRCVNRAAACSRPCGFIDNDGSWSLIDNHRSLVSSNYAFRCDWLNLA